MTTSFGKLKSNKMKCSQTLSEHKCATGGVALTSSYLTFASLARCFFGRRFKMIEAAPILAVSTAIALIGEATRFLKHPIAAYFDEDYYIKQAIADYPTDP